ncbi:hypothetical protein [Rhizobium leguminosarum]|uniref:hypothetical protein n=1 Tax=Rhizobium leguminosarum TaxID=384 RepID=UPI0012DB19C0|nr:hypothetical protein [Rhizobium leguminosarum]
MPATTYDAERLDSYRVGSTVNVRFTADRMRPLERKYRAILGKVIKECATPWTNAEAAHQALKLACGYVNVGKTASGQFMQWPRSIAEFEDPEMEDYYESVLAILRRITGVDVEALRKETAHIVENEDPDPATGEIIEHETTESGSSPHPEPDADEATPPASSAEIDESPSSSISPIPDASTPDGGPAPGEDPAGGETAPSQPPAGSENEVLIRFAADLLPKAANAEISTGTLKAIEKRWIEGAIAGLSDDGKDTARLICATMRNIANGKVKLKDEAAELADVLGCSPSAIGG